MPLKTLWNLEDMMDTFEITLADDGEPHLVDADAYELEGPMTTFFNSQSSHVRLDSWAVRIASFRSVDVRMIRRLSGHLCLVALAER